MTEQDWQDQYLMPFDEEEALFVKYEEPVNTELPGSFDWREQDLSECIHPIRDQGACGSCWAFATSEVASDRYCIGAGGKKEDNLVFSPQFLVDCDTGANACSGANTINVIPWIYKNGIPTDSCYPYESGETKKRGKCHTGTCTDELGLSTTWNKFYFEDYKTFSKKSYSVIQEEIFNNGPVYFSMNVYSDLKTYEGGIYVKAKGAKKSGGHAVKCVGWGEDKEAVEAGKPYKESHYWLIANSWGPRWGEQGYFKIRFDQDIAYKAGTLTHKVNAEAATQ